MVDTVPSDGNILLNKVSKVPCGSRRKTIKYTFEMSNSSKYNDKDKRGCFDRE